MTSPREPSPPRVPAQAGKERGPARAEPEVPAEHGQRLLVIYGALMLAMLLAALD